MTRRICLTMVATILALAAVPGHAGADDARVPSPRAGTNPCIGLTLSHSDVQGYVGDFFHSDMALLAPALMRLRAEGCT